MDKGTGPYFYLPKLESHQEARLWNDIFLLAQERMGIPAGTIKATVLIETLPAAFEMDELDLRNRIKNKMIRPTTIPQSLAELMVEQAVAREALRLAFEQHKSLAVGLKGIQQERTISDTFKQTMTGETLIHDAVWDDVH